MKNLQRYFFYFVAIWCVMCLFIRCYLNMAGFQSGKTVGKGNSEVTMSGSIATKNPTWTIIPSDNGTDRYDLNENLPAVELNYKYGLSKHFDLGLTLGYANTGITTKFNAHNGVSKFALAGGLGAGFAVGGKYLQGNVFTSYHFTDKFAIYFNPAMNHTFFRDYSFSTFYTDNLDVYGANIGLLFGNKNKFGIDLGIYEMTIGKEKFKMLNLGIGGNFIGKKKKKD